MLTRNDMLILGVAGLLLTALPLLAKAPQRTPKTVPETAVIENSGSTNTLGYTIEVRSDSLAFNMGRPPGAPPVSLDPIGVHLAPTMTHKFFRDLATAMPLTELNVRHGMRSASFGTRTFITYKGQRSPDLTFGGDERANALKADIDIITKALHIGNIPRRPVPRLMRPVVPPAAP